MSTLSSSIPEYIDVNNRIAPGRIIFAEDIQSITTWLNESIEALKIAATQATLQIGAVTISPSQFEVGTTPILTKISWVGNMTPDQIAINNSILDSKSWEYDIESCTGTTTSNTWNYSLDKTMQIDSGNTCTVSFISNSLQRNKIITLTPKYKARVFYGAENIVSIDNNQLSISDGIAITSGDFFDVSKNNNTSKNTIFSFQRNSAVYGYFLIPKDYIDQYNSTYCFKASNFLQSRLYTYNLNDEEGMIRIQNNGTPISYNNQSFYLYRTVDAAENTQPFNVYIETYTGG